MARSLWGMLQLSALSVSPSSCISVCWSLLNYLFFWTFLISELAVCRSLQLHCPPRKKFSLEQRFIVTRPGIHWAVLHKLGGHKLVNADLKRRQVQPLRGLLYTIRWDADPARHTLVSIYGRPNYRSRFSVRKINFFCPSIFQKLKNCNFFKIYIKNLKFEYFQI
jgi:hypothetical protein